MKKHFLSALTAVLLMIITVCTLTTANAAALGDVDGDGKISAADARLALRASVNLEKLTDEQFKAADVNFDGVITAADARTTLRASVNLETLHSHSYTEKITKKATCTQKGIKTFTCECGDSYTEETAAAGHKAVTDKAVAATCTTEGKTEGSHCSVCNTVLTKQSAVAKKAHTPQLDESTKKAVTCKNDGYTGDIKCTVCKTVTQKGIAVKSNGSEHSMKSHTEPASCTQDGYTVDKCVYCDLIDTSTAKIGESAKGHKYGEENTVKPTCTEKGYNVKVCSVCGADERSTYVDALGHNYRYTVTKKATCKETGSKSGTCSVCGDKTTSVVALAACTPGTEDVPGSKTSNISCKTVVKCKVCDKIISEKTSDSSHKVTLNYNEAQATCTEPRTANATCRDCNYTALKITNEALGHQAKVESSKKATCTEDGFVKYSGSCTRCSESVEGKEVVFKATGHTPNGIATCTKAVICTNCGDTLENALGHDYTSPKTYNQNIQTFYCSRCGEQTSDSLGVFNNVVNSIKTPVYYTKNTYLNYIDKTTVKTEYSRFDFGIYTSAIKNLYEQEMANNSDDYSPLRNVSVLWYLPLTDKVDGSYKVSLLEKSDIDGITVEKLTGMKFSEVLSEINPTSQDINNADQLAKINTLKTKVLNKNVIKVSVDVKNEKYSTVKKLPDTVRTSLQKISDFDMRDEVRDFPDKDANGNPQITEVDKDASIGYEVSMTMTLREITSDALVTYYFDAETYEPIIALYRTNITMDQTISMKFKISLFSLNGELDPIISTTYLRAFVFPNYTV